MFSLITRRFAVVAMLLAAFTLAGCSDKEPEQRKAFIEFLQTRMLAGKALAIPTLTDKDKEAFGPYAAHYQVITDFHAGMNQTMQTLQNATALSRKLQTMQGLQNNWKDVAQLRQNLQPVLGGIEEQLKKAQTARDALKQPDDLKAVYDQVFAKAVVQPTEIMRNVIPGMTKAMEAMEELGRFMDENRSKLEVSGSVVQIKDPSIQDKMKTLQSNYLNAAQAMVAAMQPLMGMAGR